MDIGFKYANIRFRKYNCWKLIQIDMRLGSIYVYINWHYGKKQINYWAETKG